MDHDLHGRVGRGGVGFLLSRQGTKPPKTLNPKTLNPEPCFGFKGKGSGNTKDYRLERWRLPGVGGGGGGGGDFKGIGTEGSRVWSCCTAGSYCVGDHSFLVKQRGPEK